MILVVNFGAFSWDSSQFTEYLIFFAMKRPDSRPPYIPSKPIKGKVTCMAKSRKTKA